MDKAISDGPEAEKGLKTAVSPRQQKLLEVKVSKGALNQSVKCIKAGPMGKSNMDPSWSFVTFPAANKINRLCPSQFAQWLERQPEA